MHLVQQEIVTHEVLKNYSTEKEFYDKVLAITQQSWNRWKRGERGFSGENTKKLKQLFSDYEWMIVDKVQEFLENQTNHDHQDIYQSYLDTKLTIALNWIQNDGEIQVEKKTSANEKKSSDQEIYYRVTVYKSYDLPFENNKDKISFDLHNYKGKLKKKRKKRLKWLKKNYKFAI